MIYHSNMNICIKTCVQGGVGWVALHILWVRYVLREITSFSAILFQCISKNNMFSFKSIAISNAKQIFFFFMCISIFNKILVQICSFFKEASSRASNIGSRSPISHSHYCKSGNIRGTLIFAYFAQIQQARIQKPAKIFAIFCMHILDT